MVPYMVPMVRTIVPLAVIVKERKTEKLKNLKT
jgi:hypothetical protein